MPRVTQVRRLNPAGRAARELGGDGGKAERGESQLASRLPEWNDLKEHARALECRRTLKTRRPRSGGAGRPRLEAPSCVGKAALWARERSLGRVGPAV